MRVRDSRGRGGAAAVELAVLLPFVCLLFAVAVDFCRLYHTTQTLQNAAYAGALYASGTARPGPDPATLGSATGVRLLSPADAARQAALAEAASLSPALPAANVQVTIDGGQAKVSVRYDGQLLTPVMGGSRQVTLTREVTLKVMR